MVNEPRRYRRHRSPSPRHPLLQLLEPVELTRCARHAGTTPTKRYIPLGTIMDKLGHRSPSVTLRHLGINDDEVKRATLELNL